jgi:DNA-binding MarR family transcriptional regulator
MTDLAKSNIDLVIDTILMVFPLIHRRLFIPAGISQSGISHPHHAVLNLLERDGAQSLSAAGQKLGISKPQMTAVVDKLVDLALVSRQPGPQDRRVILIAATPTGRSELRKFRQALRNNLKKRLDKLSEQDSRALAEALITIHNVSSKL